MSYLEIIKTREVSELQSFELKTWLTEELTNYALGVGYKIQEDDDVFAYAVGQFAGLITKAYKSWKCDEIHRVLQLAMTGQYGKIIGKPNYMQLATIMKTAANSRTYIASQTSITESNQYKSDTESIISDDAKNIGWKFINWSRDNKVDPEVSFESFKTAVKSGQLEEFTDMWKNTYEPSLN
jgi:hypothetical protein